MTGALHSMVRRQDGAVAVITALLMTVLLGMGALAIDIASFRLTQRQLQAATDAAALAGTYALMPDAVDTNQQDWVDKYLARKLGVNGELPSNYQGPGIAKAPGALKGYYCPVATIIPTKDRFQTENKFPGFPDGCPVYPVDPDVAIRPNAVRVTSQTTSPLYLGRVLTPSTGDVPIVATATAAQIPQAGFYAGSGLLTLDAGLINAILGGLLGTNVALNVVSYDGMLHANVSALSFFDALATNLGISAGTYGSLLDNDVTIQQVLQAEIDALNQQGSDATVVAVSELTSLMAQISGSHQLRLGDLFDLGVWQSLGLDSSASDTALQTALNVFQVATLAAQVANGQHAVAVPTVGLDIPGIATLTAAALVIEPPQHPPFVFGPVGMTVHTAQVRLQLQLKLLNLLSLGGVFGTAPVSLPIYIEIASGEATLTGISCGFEPKQDVVVTIAAQPAAARVFVGTVTPEAMSNFSQRPGVIAPAQLVNVLGLIGISGQAEVGVGSGAPTSLTFTQDDINATPPASKTVASSGMLTNLLQVLGSELELTATPDAALTPILAALLTPLLPVIKASLNTLLQPVFAALDPLVDGLLKALGIRLGYLDVTATGVRCGAPVLVN